MTEERCEELLVKALVWIGSCGEYADFVEAYDLDITGEEMRDLGIKGWEAWVE